MSRWFFEHRQEWIAQHVAVFGFINRKVIMDKFDVGSACATRDITCFKQSTKEYLQYDTSQKKYVTPYYWVRLGLMNCAEYKEQTRAKE